MTEKLIGICSNCDEEIWADQESHILLQTCPYCEHKFCWQCWDIHKDEEGIK